MSSGFTRQWVSVCVFCALLVSGVGVNAAVRNGALTVPTSTGGGVRYPDVAYDPASNAFLVVTGKARAQGAWVTPGAGAASSAFNLTSSTAYQQAPSAECGEGGVCLVVWHEGDSGTTPMARLVSKAGGFLSSPVALGPKGSNWEMTMGVAYSPAANVFMVTWMGDFNFATNKNNILIAIVNLSGQVTVKAHLTTGAAYERQPTVGFNPATGQFVVVYCGVAAGDAFAYAKAQRVNSSGGLVGGPILLDQSAADYISSVDYNTQKQAMLATWNRGSKRIYGRQLNNDGTVGPLLTLTSTYGGYDALDSAYNPITKSFLLVTHGSTVEDVGIEVSSANAALGTFTLTNDGGTGNFNPRVARSTTGTGWMAATAKSFASLIAQAASSTADAGLGGGLPPPPPPSCTVSTSPTSASASVGGSTGHISVTLSTSPCSWTATSNAGWLTVSPASGTAAATVTWTAAANTTTTSRSATVTIAGHATTVSQPGQAGTSTRGLQFDGVSGGDFLTYNKSTGSWAVRLYDGSPFTTGGSGNWSAGWQIFPAKFDAGGLTDLFYYNPSTGSWRKGLNLGGGTFSIYVPSAGLGTGYTATVLDLNGDGLSDVFLYNSSTGVWKRCISSAGATNFSVTTGTWTTGWQIVRANFNNDGRDDLFLYRPSGTSAGMWARKLSQADGTFTTIAGDKTWGAGFQVLPADFDGDGLTNILLYRSSDGAATRVTFTATSATYQSSTWNAGWTIQPGDLNGDGKADLFFYNPSSGRWVVMISASGWFTLYQTGVSAGTGWQNRVLYLDGDAKADVLWYKPSTGDNRVWITQGPTTFTVIPGPKIATGYTVIP